MLEPELGDGGFEEYPSASHCARSAHRLGLALIVGGIVAAKYGAVVIGIIVAGVNVQQFLKANKATKGERLGNMP